MVTHEAFIQTVRAAVERLYAAGLTDEQRAALAAMKLVYGRGARGLRGVTYFNQWGNHGCNSKPGHKHGPQCAHKPEDIKAGAFVEICALGEESWMQLAGTTVHEMAHVVAGSGAGHSKDWKAACVALGLRTAKAAGNVYRMAQFAPELRDALLAMEKPADGRPTDANGQPIDIMALLTGLRPCSAGVGTRGGKSRGKGSGSRLRKYECDCGQIIRAATDELDAVHQPCGSAFKLVQVN